MRAAGLWGACKQAKRRAGWSRRTSTSIKATECFQLSATMPLSFIPSTPAPNQIQANSIKRVRKGFMAQQQQQEAAAAGQGWQVG